jgi:glycosyltransferase involved in cell wall biosynthesis
MKYGIAARIGDRSLAGSMGFGNVRSALLDICSYESGGRADRASGVPMSTHTGDDPDNSTTVSKPLISVVMPTYDRPERLRRAVESVREQTYRNLELIVVDDCSPTPAEQVLSDFELEGLEVRHIRHSENRGANAARNNGIEAANGEFVAFLDDDDEWVPTKLERQVAAFSEAGPDVGVVYTGMRILYPDRTRITASTVSGDVTGDILVGRSLAPFPTVMVRACVIGEAGLPDERFPSWQDREWYLRLSRVCQFVALPEPLTIRHKRHEDRIARDYEARRDVSYPLFLSKHRSLAAEYGPIVERRFVASRSRALGTAAVRNGYYADARKYLAKSIVYYPFSKTCYTHLLAVLGGEYTYRSARKAREVIGSLS